MKTILLLVMVMVVPGLSQTAPVKMTRKYYAAPSETGVVIVASDGKVKRANAYYSYVTAGGDQATLLVGNHCSQNHTISEVPLLGSDGRYLMRARPNPAYVAVYRGGVRLQPDVHYRLYWVDKSKLPDRFELLPGAPTEGVIMVDYVLGIEEAKQVAASQIAGFE